MLTMQTFYTSVFSAKAEGSFSAFLRIARASLKEILVVRSELVWDQWGEAR